MNGVVLLLALGIDVVDFVSALEYLHGRCQACEQVPCWQAMRRAETLPFGRFCCKGPVHNAEVAYRWLDCMLTSEEFSAQGLFDEGF